MTIQIIETIKPFWYTPETSVKDKSPAKFKLKPLSGVDQAYLAQFAEILEGGRVVLASDGIEQYLRRGVIDWKGITDKKGAQIQFDEDRLCNLPHDISLELINVIRERSELGEDKAKNL